MYILIIILNKTICLKN